ncbi:hypothetical protein [Pelosinus sp. IPA-1]|uniref:hypothetical protein n=1 Tax=Pelosinus sp. IPA-1 TaxID=3029569 RepID=UPI0024362AC0|nr:hypothetical protein [Pelosinus sp. IPA-1]GMB00899.1 hypothetical protein PIPA1_36980 [Pelosinus sp. IPA-1]
MNFNGVNNLMRQQLGAIKDLEELLDLDSKQDPTHTISKEDIALFKDHVDRLKKVCETAMAISQHYQAIDKAEAVINEADNEEETSIHPVEGAQKTPSTGVVKEPAKRSRTRKAKVEPEPVEENFDDLLD